MRHRLFLLGLMVLTVVGVGVSAPSEFPPGSLMAVVESAAGFVVAGLLVVLWTAWARVERRQP